MAEGEMHAGSAAEPIWDKWYDLAMQHSQHNQVRRTIEPRRLKEMGTGDSFQKPPH